MSKDRRLTRRDFLRSAAVVGVGVPLANFLAACGGPAPQTTEQQAGGAVSEAIPTTTPVPTPASGPRQGGQVIVGLSQEPTKFNPLTPSIEVDRGAQYALFDSLWRINREGQFVPVLATEIPSVQNGGISEDGLEYTIHLRDDVQWHDGKPFTARDVKFTHETIMNPDFIAGSRVGHDRVESFDVVDDYTVKFRLKEPFAPMMGILMDTMIVPEHILSGVSDLNTADFNSTAPVGTGPFTFKERVAGDHITFEANPNYFGEGPYVDQIIMKYIPDLTVLFTQFKTGDIDVIGLQGITADHYHEATELEGRNLFIYETAFVEYIYMNFGHPQFQDKTVREALYLAMDKNTIIEDVYLGIHEPSESYLPTVHWAWNPNLPKHEYDPEQAKAILDEAGWTVGSDGVREKDGVKLSFTCSTTAGNKVREQAQAYLQQNWKDIGVDMQINNMPPAVVWGEYYTKSQFDTLMVGIQVMLGGDPDALTRFGGDYIPVEGGGGKNVQQYKNPELDKLLEEGVRETDREKRKEIYWKAQEILREDLGYLPIFHYYLVEGTKAELANYKPNLYVVSNCWNMNEWYWQA